MTSDFEKRFNEQKPRFEGGEWSFPNELISCKRCGQSDDLVDGLCEECFVPEKKRMTREQKRPALREWATNKFYNEVWINMSFDDKLRYVEEHKTTICEIEEHHSMLQLGL